MVKLKLKKMVILIFIILVILSLISMIEFETKKLDQQTYDLELSKIKEQNMQPNVGLEVGNKAPNFVLATLEGKKLSLWEFAGKKAVILNFWATWCPPCKKEMPLLQRYYEKFDQDSYNLEILAINMQEDPALVKEWIKDFSMTYTILLDPAEQAKSSYNIYAKPTTFFIDKTGIIRAKKLGQLTEDELDANFKLILDKPK